MKTYTLWDKLLDFVWHERINSLEYFFAKRWLDKNFGAQEYWGDYLAEKLNP